MLFHNHPSGNPEPSFEDMVLTKRFIEVGELMGIPAVDHIIVGGGSGEIYSFRENTDLFSKNSRSKEAKESEKIKESVRQDRRSVIGKLSEKKKELEENRLFEKAGHETKRTHEEVRN
jgi:proteasome lid subunit RPN8/RPN11